MENPSLARSAHRRIYDMIVAEGRDSASGGANYSFFSQELFGLEEPLRVLVEEYLKPAAMGMEVKNRVLLLVGPVGTGKSTIVRLIKKGLERYSASNEGALYGIKGCPMHEEPLHLIPQELRGGLEQRGIRVDGALCPRCRLMVELEYGGRVGEVPVERVFISEAGRVGIGTFVPSDPKSQDIAELTGSIDFSSIAQYGAESDPRAYNFDGELNKANRGVMEFQELLKCDEKFLYNLLSLAQEGNFKAGRFALISADEMIIGHSNQAEYEEFIREGRNAAMASRLFVVPVPYNLSLSEEERIYKKLLEGKGLEELHLEPHALRSAAMFSILSRLEDPCKQGIGLVKKMYLYDGCLEGRFTEKDVEELQSDSRDEGLRGVDPRYVLNRICSSLATASDGCVTSLEILESLKKGLRFHPSIAEGEVARLEELLFLTVNEFRALVKKDLAELCLRCYPDIARQVFSDYMNSVAGSLEVPFLHGEEAPIDVQLMDFIEGCLQISKTGKKEFREELYNRNLKYASMGRSFDYAAHSGLKSAVEAEILRRVLLQETGGGQESLLTERLAKALGYCHICARKAFGEVSNWLCK